MHPSLELIFEHLQGGLVWLSADGRIKYANAKSRKLGGLQAGQALPEGTLKKAVAVVASGKLGKNIEMEFLPPEGEQRLLHATVAPAMTLGDAFVFIEEAAPHGEPLALDNLMTVIRSDVAPPLERLSTHAMFQGEARERLKMCSDCRVIDLYSASGETKVTDL